MIFPFSVIVLMIASFRGANSSFEFVFLDTKGKKWPFLLSLQEEFEVKLSLGKHCGM